MKIHYFRNFLLGLAGALLIALGLSLFTATTATTTFYYAVTDLGTLGGYSGISANSINDAGQVVGTSPINHLLTPGTGPPHAFLWSNGTMKDLGTLGGRYGNATSINNKGEVVGDSQTLVTVGPGYSWEQHAFLWGKLFFKPPYMSTEMQDLGTLGGNSSIFEGNASYAYGINDATQVVGVSTTSSNTRHAFFWSDGKMTDLGTLGGTYSQANGINNQGLIVGSADTSDGHRHAFTWYMGKMTDLSTPNGYSSSAAVSVNKLGVVVGSVGNIGGASHAFAWYMDATLDLGTLGGDYSAATSISDKGLVVGRSKTSSGRSHAFVWLNGTIVDLNSLLPANSGWELWEAQDVNNNGQIVGNGTFNGQMRAFLLTPTWIIN